jgi:hypothetical protein
MRLGKFPMVRKTLFCRRCNFSIWLSAANSQAGQALGHVTPNECFVEGQFNVSQTHIATDSQTVSQSVSLGVEPPLGLMLRYLLLFDSYGLIFCGAPSLTRRRVCLLNVLLALASAVPTIFYCLKFETSFFVASYGLAGSRWRYSTPSLHWF